MRRLVLLVLVTSCSERLRGIASELSVAAQAISFPATVVGDTSQQPLQLTNASRAPLKLHLSAAAPFVLERDLTLPGGASTSVDLPFTPDAVGAFTGTLHVTGDSTADVALDGEGVAAAACVDPSPCRAARRDEATNTCVAENRPDGTACTPDDACLAQGQCLAGACVGTVVSCDDGNACTIDACEPVGGCAHFAKSCPAPADPCQVALCDATGGCSTAPAADGTACGPSDCTTAHVCMAGTCRVLAVPDGYACGEESPCRPRGRCSAGACAQPPASWLTEAWQLVLPYDVDFRGATDAAGNLYWVECFSNRQSNPCELVSYTPGGLQRLRVQLTVLSASTGSRYLLAGGRVYVVGRNGSVEAFSDATGARLWVRSPLPSSVTSALVAAVADGRGLLHVATEEIGRKTQLSSLDASGNVVRSRVLNGPIGSLLVDEADNLYFDVRDTEDPLGMASSVDAGASGAGAAYHLVSLSPSGAVRYVVPLDTPDAPRATFNGELLQASGTLRHSLDGSAIAATNTYERDLGLPSALMSATTRYRWTELTCGVGACPAVYVVGMVGSPAGSGVESFTFGGFGNDPPVSEPQLLSDGSALFASESPGTHEVQLRSIDPTGAERFACTLDTALIGNQSLLHFQGATALTQNRWAVLKREACLNCLHDPPPVLEVYDVPGLLVAGAGWTGRDGSPGRSGTAR